MSTMHVAAVGPAPEWMWVQPRNRDELLIRLAHARDFDVPARERENLCSVAHGEIARVAQAIEHLHSVCTFYCQWYEKGRSCDAGDVAYTLVSGIRQSLETLDPAAAKPDLQPEPDTIVLQGDLQAPRHKE